MKLGSTLLALFHVWIDEVASFEGFLLFIGYQYVLDEFFMKSMFSFLLLLSLDLELLFVGFEVSTHLLRLILLSLKQL